MLQRKSLISISNVKINKEKDMHLLDNVMKRINLMDSLGALINMEIYMKEHLPLKSRSMDFVLHIWEVLMRSRLAGTRIILNLEII